MDNKSLNIVNTKQKETIIKNIIIIKIKNTIYIMDLYLKLL